MSANVAELSPEAWDTCMSYYASGYSRGIERGRELADEDAARLWCDAAKVVRNLAGCDPLPGSEWMTHATSEQLTEAAEKREVQGIARFRAAHAADRSAYLSGGAA